jgi:hypothetical protein
MCYSLDSVRVISRACSTDFRSKIRRSHKILIAGAEVEQAYAYIAEDRVQTDGEWVVLL